MIECIRCCIVKNDIEFRPEMTHKICRSCRNDTNDFDVHDREQMVEFEIARIRHG